MTRLTRALTHFLADTRGSMSVNMFFAVPVATSCMMSALAPSEALLEDKAATIVEVLALVTRAVGLGH
ncbi:hypothetical protein [Pseudooceanicola nitratireducens]|uniref:hypothetical protein n=1 Tax=Pseudooceanicola nitratireducens TaxID=517719 RepID=UPI0023F47647|nr:hypothetical protein [Pseudooceanicola nitratireducens]